MEWFRRAVIGTLFLLAAVAPPAAAAPIDSSETPAVVSGDSLSSDSLATSLLRPDSAMAARAARGAEAPPESLGPQRTLSAPVFLGGREIFRVQVPRDGLDAQARATAIRARLTQAVTDPHANPDSVRLVPRPDGIEIQLGSHFLWVITPGDAPTRDPNELAIALAELPREIAEGVRRERLSRRPARVLVSVAIALALTLLALGLLRLLLAGRRRWLVGLKRSLGARLPAIRLRDFEVLSRAQAGGLLAGLFAAVELLFGAALLYAYLTSVFSLFPWTQGWSSLLLTFALSQSLNILRTIVSGLPGLFTIVVILAVFRWLNGLAARFFDAVGNGSLVLGGFHPELATPSRKLASILLWVVAIMVAYPYIPGSGSRAVQGVSLLLGVMVSLGSTGIIGNVMAGIVLTYSRSFRVGDRVRIGDHVGDVVHLGFFATKLRSIRNEEITLPNGQVAGAAILNYTRLADGPGLVLHTQVSIGYDVDWRKVHELLVEAASKVEGVEREPRPWVFQRSLNDSYPVYELNCLTRDSHAQLRLYSDLHAEIQDAFSRAGVEILSPAYHAVRDANAPVLPSEPAGPRAAPGGFRVRGGEGAGT